MIQIRKTLFYSWKREIHVKKYTLEKKKSIVSVTIQETQLLKNVISIVNIINFSPKRNRVISEEELEDVYIVIL